MARVDWRDEAECKDLFMLFDYDRVDYESDRERIAHEKGRVIPITKNPTRYMMMAAERAIRICNMCPVKTECLEDALYYGDEYTIRGGMTPYDRLALMKQRGIKSYTQRRIEEEEQ